MTPYTANEAICKFLGIKLEGKPITKVELALRPGKLPMATITYAVSDAHLTAHRQSFELHPLDQPDLPPLDLDALCAKAMKRVHKTIERCAARQSRAIGLGFATLRMSLTTLEFADQFAAWVKNPYGHEFHSGAYGRRAKLQGGAA